MKPPSELSEPHEPIDYILLPIQRFTNFQPIGGILLMVCTVIAMVWANSPWHESYVSVWQTRFEISFGGFQLDKPLLLWINDALMAAFFFVVGLEIKREVLVGELASFRRAALPIAAAVGGMLVPASLFIVLNYDSVGARGWGVPMATDIAFALGVLALLGSRVPVSAKIFLTALAIVDDIGAALVIAFFYTEKISWLSLGIAGGFFILMVGANRIGIRNTVVYATLGFFLWLAFLKSGVHPTLSGILGAMAIPARMRINALQFVKRSRFCINEFERAGHPGESVLASKEQREALTALENACLLAETPLQKLEHEMHPWVSYLIMPLFALANAGVVLDAGSMASLNDPVAIGIILGLVLGKQIGITTFAWLAVKSGYAQRPKDLTWRHIYGVGWLGGIGFTMSLFVANLAFDGLPQLDVSKMGILSASLVAGFGGWIVLSSKRKPRKDITTNP